jgi:hypothetical protein
MSKGPGNEHGVCPGRHEEVIEIPHCRLGRKKQVLCGAVLAHVGATCYLACHPDDVGDVLSFYQKRVWIEEQNRDIKTGFKGRVMRHDFFT